jgi:hypothetical protein
MVSLVKVSDVKKKFDSWRKRKQIERNVVPFVYDDLYEICRERRFLIDWLQNSALLDNFSRKCDSCNDVRLVEDKSYIKVSVVWRCSNRQCKKKKPSVREAYWFSGTHLLLEQAVKLTYY